MLILLSIYGVLLAFCKQWLQVRATYKLKVNDCLCYNTFTSYIPIGTHYHWLG